MQCRACGQTNSPGRLYCAQCGASLGHFVGRQGEIERLQGALEDALAGTGRVILITGEPGIGKTRTAEELAAHAGRRAATVFWGRSHEGEGAPAYWPWVQVLRAYLRGRDGTTIAAAMGPGAPDIAQLVPEMRERIPDLAAPLALEPEQARFRLFDSLTTFLKNVAAAEPLVLIFDDLHLADQPSLLLLQFVAGEAARTRILIVGTYRHTEVGRHHPFSDTLSELARHPHTERLLLRGLPDGDVGHLIRLIAGERTPPALVSAVCRQTEGNPFFICELIPLLLAEPGLQAADAESFALAVPQGVREVIGRRLNRLSKDCNRVLALAAVIGREFDVALLECLSELRLDDVLALIEEATAAHVVREVPRSVGRYSFGHALIRETLYEEVPSLRRVQLHRRVGEALEQLHPGRIDAYLPELAYHFFAAAPAGEADRAIAYATRAGARAVAQLAFEDAAGHYRRALHTLELLGHTDETVRCDLLLALGEALTGAGESAEARQTFLRAAEVARRSGTPERLARAALGVGTGFQGFWGYGAGLIDEQLVRLLEESLQALGSEDSALRALVLGRLAVALYWSPDRERRASIGRLGADAVAVAERIGDPAVLLLALASSHWADWTPDNLAERLAVASRIVGLAAHVGHPEMNLLGHAFHLAAELESGHIHQVEADIDAFGRLADETRQPRYLWWATMFRTMRPLLAGRFAEAEALAQEALVIGERAQASDAVQSFGAYMFTIRREVGGLEELAEATAALGEQHPTIPAWLCGAALLLAEGGRGVEARRLLDRLTADELAALPRDLTWLVSMALLAETVTLLRDGQRAAQLYELLQPYEDRCVVIGYGLACWGSLARYLGMLAGALRRWDDAIRHFEHAHVANLRIGARPAVARTLHDHGTMRLARDAPGDREAGRALLAESRDIAVALGMTRLAQSVDRLAAADVPPAQGAGSTEAAVFRREGEFWTLVFEGTVCRLRDSRGLHYVAVLLRHPGEEFHARDLISPAGAESGARDTGSAGPAIDPQARSEYRRRLADLRDNLEEAERFNDAGRAERARTEIEFLAHELSAAVGLGNRTREAASSSERARLAVTKRIRDALARIRTEHPSLGRHLEAAIRTGQFCSYQPPSGDRVSWVL